MQSKFQLPSIPGLLLIVLFAAVATALSTLSFFQHLSLSPLVVGILIGIVFANTLGRYLPEEWRSGLKFCSKRILRIGIIFFGFRLTLADVAQVGLSAVALDIFIVCSTIGLGLLVGKWLNMDKETTLLTSSGSAICGAAAVLGAETTLKSEAYKTAVAVSTVVLFGTLSMFLYPVLYRNGFFPLSTHEMGLYTGSTVHEVAHVVGASNAMGKEVAEVAVIVKMIRVILLVPVLLVFSWSARSRSESVAPDQRRLVVPWFASSSSWPLPQHIALALACRDRADQNCRQFRPHDGDDGLRLRNPRSTNFAKPVGAPSSWRLCSIFGWCSAAFWPSKPCLGAASSPNCRLSTNQTTSKLQSFDLLLN